MPDEFMTPEEGEVFTEYKRLAHYNFFVERITEANNAFLVVKDTLRRAFNESACLDNDYPLRAALIGRKGAGLNSG